MSRLAHTSHRDDLEWSLRERRAELLRGAAACERALRAIAEERESELEEGAQEGQLDRVLSRLDDRERRELVELNAALDRIADGSYGRCTGCERPIETERLAAVPETAVCLRCAGARETPHVAPAPASRRSGAVPADLALLGDDETTALLREAVEADGRIDLEELRLSYRDGVVHLAGVLPSAAELAMLRRIVEDVLGFRDVVDRIRIDETPWERADRAKRGPSRPAGFEPLGTEDVFESVEEGVAFAPADRPPAEED